MEDVDNTIKFIDNEDNQHIIKNLELRKFIQFKLNQDVITKNNLDTINEIILDSKNIIGQYNKVYFEEIKLFQNLEKIIIKNLGITNETIKKLGSIKQLEFKDCEIQNISELNKVENLTLIHSKIESIEKIGELDNLNELQLINMKIENFEFLNKLEKLKTLKIKNVKNFTLSKINVYLPIEYLSIEKIEQLDTKIIKKFNNLKVLSVDRKEAENWEKELNDLKSNKIEILLNDIYRY